MDNINNISDITFVGSGISTSFTLINLLNQIEKNVLKDKTTITIVDKYSEFNTGIPYSSRSGFSTLLITSLLNFLPEPELTMFYRWLKKNKGWLLEEFKKEGGDLSKQWLSNHQVEIDKNQWEDLFIPRRFFGCYIDERVKEIINDLERKKKISVRFINSEIVNITKPEDFFKVSMENGKNLLSKRIVLSVGSLPFKNLWKDKDIIEEENLMFVNNPYKPELKSSLDRIKTFLEKRKIANKKTNVLIIGANASALELLYKLNDTSIKKSESNFNDFTFLSTQGKIPDSIIDQERKMQFKATNLLDLHRNDSLTADKIAKAAFEDIKRSEEISLGAASTVETISSAFGSLLSKLSYSELEKFACQYGNQIGKKQRCAGIHYTNTVLKLKEENRFKHIAGRFIDIELNNDEYVLKYLDTETQKELIYDKKIHLIINCIGGMDLTQKNLPQLHKNLMKNNLCDINDSKIGFKVNDSLEASSDLHIMGPLLAGNVINNNAVWHVEHCGRIIWLSGMLSKTLFNSIRKENLNLVNLLNPDGSKLVKSQFEIITDKNNWDSTLKEIGCYDFYHTYDYHKLSAQNGENPTLIKYVENNVIIALPLIIRDIYSTIYKDATSVYGYAGPISNGIDEKFNNYNFIKSLKSYFNENNIISVFSRLNPYIPNQNEILFGYGDLAPQGKVVNIDLKLSLDEQRSKYRSRLKTYINKARREYSIISGSSNEDLDIFIKLYYENMDRVNAKKYYYFSKNYFEKIINSTDFKTSILFVVDNKTKEVIGSAMFIETNKIIQYHLSGTKKEYAKLNPIKLLIDEMRIKSTEQGFQFFNLGGGLGGSDDDSLFHFKSSFSKDFSEFHLWKWITNKKIYDKLVSTKKGCKKRNYFPLYRAIEDINVQL
ncbi:peptidoglycan bridge formation glycyltransferase FemA/FemB family protein [Thalassobellus citreus]|uniref:peptidoglycan bridge formation glycyltransferase FemA/FemB family protein n=1 Tax=Thalassobellus citreus TaxID=3367752 RepID=UPI003796C67E